MKRILLLIAIVCSIIQMHAQIITWANKNGEKSGWSKYKEVNLQEGSGLQRIMRDENLFEYELYTLGGVKSNQHPRPGVYIKKNKKGFVKKTFIK